MTALSFISDWSERLSEEIGEQIKRCISPLAPYLRRLGTGVLILLLSGAGWGMALAFLLLALFFSLAPLHPYVAAALWVSLLAALIGLCLLLVGFILIRKPR